MQPLSPVPARDVEIREGFWARRLDVVRAVTLPHCMDRCEETGRLRNFDRAAGRRSDAYEGRFYDDSDVYKVLEGAAHALAWRPDPDLQTRVDDWIGRICAAQAPDGYLNTWHTTHPIEGRFSDVQWKHELYCVGHLVEAGLTLAHRLSDAGLLLTALRTVEHVAGTFGADGLRAPPGHPELELALLRLHRRLRPPRVLELARFFLEQRGCTDTRPSFGELCQDHLPIREQRSAAGHAVRATYLWAAATDLATLAGDRSWLPALDALWEDVTKTRMYVTGGIGSSAKNEGFTDPFDLPNDTAYAETCAAIGLALWARRMGLAQPDARYADVLERALYNGVLAGLSLTGDRFFYVNPLQSDGSHERQPWFDTACCPSNLLRFLPSVGGLAYAAREGEAYVDLYVSSRAKVGPLTLTVETSLPWEGSVHVVIDDVRDSSAALHLRIPGWCSAFELRVNGERVDAEIDRGYAPLRRRWQRGDIVDLDLTLAVERVRADDCVAANEGRVALQRGPLVYCVEGVDHDGRVHDLVLPTDAVLEPVPQPEILDGLLALEGKAHRSDESPVRLRAVPYFAWANRGKGEMAVWLVESTGAG